MAGAKKEKAKSRGDAPALETVTASAPIVVATIGLVAVFVLYEMWRDHQAQVRRRYS